MKSKIILVTGATGGIGHEIVQHLCSLGATVVAVGRNEEKLNRLSLSWPKQIICCKADLLEDGATAKVFNFCKEHKLMLNGVVHCAGIVYNCPLRCNDEQQNQSMMRLNFGVFTEICHFACSRRYVAKGASIIAMSSISSLSSSKGIAVYAASKAAVNSLVQSAAAELLSRQIRVNAIAPAMVRTQMYTDSLSTIPDFESALLASQPLGIIEPIDVAYAAEYLLSEKSRFVTGSTLVISAGRSA